MFSVNGPLLSRSTLFRLRPHSPESLTQLARRALDRERMRADDDAIAHLVNRADGDGRSLLTSLEVAIAIVGDDSRPIALADAEAAADARVLRYGEDEHYDVISAFIKSVRGSDPDAALYWLARMLTAGEDPRFVARRIVILASEDVGLADPMALVVADAAARAVEFVGMPEAQLALAQATVHLACAPKSNRAALGIWGAMAEVQERAAGAVPLHLRDAHYPGAKKLGHGRGYEYPHDATEGWVPQQHLPDDLIGRRFYEPSAHGHEGRIAERLNARRSEAASVAPAGEGEHVVRGARSSTGVGQTGPMEDSR